MDSPIKSICLHCWHGDNGLLIGSVRGAWFEYLCLHPDGTHKPGDDVTACDGYQREQTNGSNEASRDA